MTVTTNLRGLTLTVLGPTLDLEIVAIYFFIKGLKSCVQTSEGLLDYFAFAWSTRQGVPCFFACISELPNRHVKLRRMNRCVLK